MIAAIKINCPPMPVTGTWVPWIRIAHELPCPDS